MSYQSDLVAQAHVERALKGIKMVGLHLFDLPSSESIGSGFGKGAKLEQHGQLAIHLVPPSST